jgi:hypothetical protein
MSGGSTSDMENLAAVLDGLQRQFDSLEQRLASFGREQRSSFRWLSGIMLGGFTAMLGGLEALFGVMAHGFHWL